MNTINNELIRSFRPCYDPSKYVKDENEDLPVLEAVNKYRGIVPDEDIIWLLCREEFMSSRDLRLFAIWCAREALKLVDNPDPRSIEACNVAERYANGEATDEDLRYAYAAAFAAYTTAYAAHAADAAYAAVRAAYPAAARTAARAAARADYAADRAASRAVAAQLDKLLTYFS